MRRTVTIILTLAALPSAVWGFCFQEAGEEYGVAPEILYNIASVESSFKPTVIHWNTNGTYDYGLMGINSKWTEWSPYIRKMWPYLGDPCINVKAGAWILSKCIKDYGYTWQGIGCYNSRTPEFNREYAQKIFKSMVKHRREGRVLLATTKHREPERQKHPTPWEEVFSHDSE
ncbi:transglycosylase (plasmid) [Geobacter anodireducens]|nr:transglycosylase [Geobacter anodireducens]